MHQGCVAGANGGGRGAARWWPTSPNSRSAGRPTTPASWPPTTSSICPATASPQAAGTAPPPAAWGCRAKHRRPGSRPCSRAATPTLASCSAVPMVATPCPPSTSSCALPRASRSSTAWATQPPAERYWRPTTPGWPKRSPTWTDTWGPAAATAVSSTCPDRDCWRSASITGHPEKGTRCCTPTWSSPTGSRARTAAGRPWTAGTCTGIGWLRTLSTGPPTSASCPERWESSGQQRTLTGTGSSKACPRTWSGCSPSGPARSTSRSSVWKRRVGSGHPGWSSGSSTPPASPRSTRPRTPCMDAGERRRPGAATIRTPWSGR
jgi:hypothetical protein